MWFLVMVEEEVRRLPSGQKDDAVFRFRNIFEFEVFVSFGVVGELGSLLVIASDGDALLVSLWLSVVVAVCQQWRASKLPTNNSFTSIESCSTILDWIRGNF